jgi:hypothetical protein
MEIVFNVTQEGDTWEQLRDNVREAVSAYFFDQPKPAGIRLHLVRDEVLAWA